MFSVYASNQEGQYPLYEPLDDTLRIFDPVLTQEMGCGGCFQFSIFEGHPYVNKIGLLKSEIIVYTDDREIFRGRMLKPEYTMQKLISVTVEGDLAYLIDSQQRPYEFTGSVKEFIGRTLELHNSQVDDFKKIYPGTITVTNTIENSTYAETKYTTSLETLMAKLQNQIGGYLRIRNEKGKKYLDYLWDFGGINEQVIRFGENLLDINRCIDATSIITCLIPEGADVEYTDSIGEKQVKTVDITSVNGGKNYIENETAIERYGKITGYHKWNDITEPDALLAKANAYLREATALPDAMEINALDLSLIDETVAGFHLGYWTLISSEPHGIEKQLLLRKRVINLLKPEAGSVSLGDTVKTFTDQVTKNQQDTMAEIGKSADRTSAEINRKVENATSLIAGGLGGYVVIDNIDPVTGKKMHPWRILIMNTPNKETAKHVIQFNQNGIGFSTNGIDGPYENAWTIDGNLVADFITTGTMLSERIRGGIYEVGGSGLGMDGKIVIKNDKDEQIGYWDKTGLHVMVGEISGTTIRGSKIIGSTIDVANGTFEVDEDGAVVISSGEINIGNVNITENYAWIGDYGISGTNDGVFYSRDSGHSVEIHSAASRLENGPMIKLKKGNLETIVGFGGINTKDIALEKLYDKYGPEWEDVATNIIELWNRIADIENQL